MMYDNYPMLRRGILLRCRQILQLMVVMMMSACWGRAWHHLRVLVRRRMMMIVQVVRG